MMGNVGDLEPTVRSWMSGVRYSERLVLKEIRYDEPLVLKENLGENFWGKTCDRDESIQATFNIQDNPLIAKNALLRA